MNRFLSILLAGFLFLGYSSCKNKNKGGSGQAYTLKMKLAPGDKFGYDMDMQMKMDMAGLGLGVKMNMKMNSEMEVMGDSAGLTKLKFTTSNVEMKMDMPAMLKSAELDSIMEKSRDTVSRVMYLYIDKKNEIVKVEGYDEMFDEQYAENPQMREQMRKMFSKDELNSMMGMMFQIYPAKPVRVGDEWENEGKFSMSSIKMGLKNKYRLKQVKDGMAVIAITADFDGKGKLAEEGMNFEVDMDGEQEGTIGIGIDNGYMRNADYKMDMNAKAKIMGGSVPIEIKATYVMKGH